MSAARHYVQRIDTDNLKQDFEQAIQKEFNDVKTETQNMVKEMKSNQADLQKANSEYKKTIDERIKNNETAFKQYDQAFNRLTKGITVMFFIFALTMVAFLVLNSLGDLLGVHHFYEWINYVLKTEHSAWRYFILLLYLVPYLLFGLLIYTILRAYKSI
ncbi:mobilization protein [Staphylococcus pasteuri]|uniref:mobilization protein n=1 Tax=Staphylococcus pasteuri TaxID=45972 RepID=UPI003F554948